ncbi:MAG: hypothetical protein K2Q01_04845 [Rickettsiales bacterium]|nr:hypothetical protein [Rickettsiales bacterium]
MAESSVKPDYKKWWEKKSVTHDDMCWLLVGIDPDHQKRAEKIRNLHDSATHEERVWLSEFDESYDPFAGDEWRANKHIIEWEKDKKKFVQKAYEAYRKIPSEFLDFLVASGGLIKNENLEKYKDYSLYIRPIMGVELKSVTSEEDAIFTLLGLKPEYFNKFSALYDRQKNEPKDANGYAAYVRFSPDEKWFFSEYKQFIEKYLHEFAFSLLRRAITNAMTLVKWEGNFASYVQQLHNEGFIFKREVYSYIAQNGIELQYSEDSWAMRFYKYWLKQGGWTFEEAVSLFKGNDPRPNQRSYVQLGQNVWLLSHTGDHCWVWDEFSNRFENLLERLERHITVGGIQPYERNGKDPLFKPSEVIEWLEAHSLYMPPTPLNNS